MTLSLELAAAEPFFLAGGLLVARAFQCIGKSITAAGEQKAGTEDVFGTKSATKGKPMSKTSSVPFPRAGLDGTTLSWSSNPQFSKKSAPAALVSLQ
jgi:hypothetical protein